MNAATNPTLSIVVPTRDRPDTLKICLETLIEDIPGDGSVEVVVQDNASDERTATLLAGIKHPAIKVFRSEDRLSMRGNFERALSNARGDYMIMIGDDDSLAIGAVAFLVSLLRTQPDIDAVRWRSFRYVWPNLSSIGKGFIEIHGKWLFGGLSVASGRAIAAKSLHARLAGSWDSVLVYHGVISRRVYDRMKQTFGGNFFAYDIPDVFAHNVLPFLTGRVVAVYHPLSVYGVSAHSSGTAWSTSKADAKAATAWEEERLADPASGVVYHASIKTLRFHDFCSLRLAAARGLCPNPSLKDWLPAMLKEVRANPWQQSGFKAFAPLTPEELAIREAVLALGALPETPPAKVLAPGRPRKKLYRAVLTEAYANRPDEPDDLHLARRAAHTIMGAYMPARRVPLVTRALGRARACKALDSLPAKVIALSPLGENNTTG